MTLGLIGGDLRHAHATVVRYRAAGTGTGHRADRLKLVEVPKRRSGTP